MCSDFGASELLNLNYLVYDNSCPRKGCVRLLLGRGKIPEYLEAPLVPFDAVYLLPLRNDYNDVTLLVTDVMNIVTL